MCVKAHLDIQAVGDNVHGGLDPFVHCQEPQLVEQVLRALRVEILQGRRRQLPGSFE